MSYDADILYTLLLLYSCLIVSIVNMGKKKTTSQKKEKKKDKKKKPEEKEKSKEKNKKEEEKGVVAKVYRFLTNRKKKGTPTGCEEPVTDCTQEAQLAEQPTGVSFQTVPRFQVTDWNLFGQQIYIAMNMAKALTAQCLALEQVLGQAESLITKRSEMNKRGQLPNTSFFLYDEQGICQYCWYKERKATMFADKEAQNKHATQHKSLKWLVPVFQSWLSGETTFDMTDDDGEREQDEGAQEIEANPSRDAKGPKMTTKDKEK